MKTTENRLKYSDVPAFVSLWEYSRLREQDKLILRDGKYYLIRDRRLRPVHIRWRY